MDGDGAFACPECGCEIRPVGLTPGRQVRCAWCTTWVEVPFIPRADQIKRMRRDRASRRRRRGVWAWFGIGAVAAAVALTAVGTRRVVLSRWQAADTEAVSRLIESSREAEGAGRLGEALAALEGALALADRCRAAPPGLDELREHRTELARREARAELAALDSAPVADPARAVGRALTLRARVEKDPALAELGEGVRATVDRLRLLWIEADAAAARAAEESGRPDKAYELALRQLRNAEELSAAARSRRRADADALARRLIERHGTVVEPVHGHFTLGSVESYEPLRAEFATALRTAGYLPRPKSGLWDDLWATLAPYRLTFDVTEKHEDTYLSSPNRLSRIDLRLNLTRRGETLWAAGPSARTTVPVPGLSAYQASRMAASSQRSPEFERLLYDNARANLGERAVIYLRSLPVPTSPPADDTASASP